MYERTDICPYTEICENFHSLIRIMNHLYGSQGKMISGETSLASNNYITDDLEKTMKKLTIAKEKCLHYHNRCLKFWQFKAQIEA